MDNACFDKNLRRGIRYHLVFRLRGKNVTHSLCITAINPWHTGYPSHSSNVKIVSIDGQTIDNGNDILNIIMSFDNMKEQAALMKIHGWPIDAADSPIEAGLAPSFDKKDWFILGENQDKSEEATRYLTNMTFGDMQRIMTVMMETRAGLDNWRSYYRIPWLNRTDAPWSLWHHLPQNTNRRDERKSAKFDL